MAKLPIYNSFHPILKQKTKKIIEITDEIKQLVVDMFETMYETDRGVGLAANQVGRDVSIVVIDVKEVKGLEETPPLVLINPVIKTYSEETEFCEEGCLSIPVLYDEVERSTSIIIEYKDMSGVLVTKEISGFLARVMQHEVDHLNGIIFYDRLSAFRKSLAKNKMKRLKRGDYDIDYPMIDANGDKHE